MPNVLIKHLGYKSHRGGKNAKGLKSIKDHMKYIQNRKTELGEKGDRELFGKEGEMNRQDFYQSLKEQPQRGVIAHKFVFSMEKGNFEANNIDYEGLTKDMMSSFEAKTGKQFNWIACVHEKDKNPHVHLILAGRDNTGREIAIMKPQLNQLKNIAEKTFEHHQERNQQRQLNPQKEFDPMQQIEDEKQFQPSKENGLSRDLGIDKAPSKGLDLSFDDRGR